MFTVKSNVSTTDTFGTHTTCPSESQIKGFKNGMDQFWVSVLPRCPSYRELLNKGSQERQGPTLGVRLTEVSVL